jgi:hypothetical protein
MSESFKSNQMRDNNIYNMYKILPVHVLSGSPHFGETNPLPDPITAPSVITPISEQLEGLTGDRAASTLKADERILEKTVGLYSDVRLPFYPSLGGLQPILDFYVARIARIWPAHGFLSPAIVESLWRLGMQQGLGDRIRKPFAFSCVDSVSEFGLMMRVVLASKKWAAINAIP